VPKLTAQGDIYNKHNNCRQTNNL